MQALPALSGRRVASTPRPDQPLGYNGLPVLKAGRVWLCKRPREGSAPSIAPSTSYPLGLPSADPWNRWRQAGRFGSSRPVSSPRRQRFSAVFGSCRDRLKSRRRGNLQRYAVPEMAVSWPHSTVPWLQRQLLPTAVMEPSQDEPAVRDRVIDGVLVVVAAALGAVSLASSWAGRDAWSLWLEVGLGSVACAALALRRRHPTAVAVLALAATTVSLLAGVAALSRAVQRRSQIVASRAGLDLRAIPRLERDLSAPLRRCGHSAATGARWPCACS